MARSKPAQWRYRVVCTCGMLSGELKEVQWITKVTAARIVT